MSLILALLICVSIVHAVKNRLYAMNEGALAPDSFAELPWQQAPLPALTGSQFELEKPANFWVDVAGDLDWENVAASNFYPATSGTGNIVAVSAFEEHTASGGVFFHLNWFWDGPSDTAGEVVVELRQYQAFRSLYDLQLSFRPASNLVVVSLWTCTSSGDCAFTGPGAIGGGWNLGSTLASCSSNDAIPAAKLASLPPFSSPPASVAQLLAGWKVNGLGANQFGKGSVNLLGLPCFAQETCMNWHWVVISNPKNPTNALPPLNFDSGNCAEITILKTDASGAQNLSGAVFGLYKPITGTTQKGGDSLTSCTTGLDGTCRFIMKAGTYVVSEQKPPVGYLVAPDQVWVAVNGAKVVYTFRDSSGNSRTGLKFQKVDNTGLSLLNGASFVITHNGVNYSFPVQAGVWCTDSQNPPVTFPVDSRGCLTFDIYEVAAPIGYNVAPPQRNVSFCINSDPAKQNCSTRAVAAVFKDSLASPNVTIIKTGAGPSVDGAVFGLSTSGDSAQDLTKITLTCTIKQGSCSIAALPGIYFIIEVKAPAGYSAAPPQGPYTLVMGKTYSFTVVEALKKISGAPKVQKLDSAGKAVDLRGSRWTVSSNGVTKTYNITTSPTVSNILCIEDLDSWQLDAVTGCANFTVTEEVPPTGYGLGDRPTQTMLYCAPAVASACSERAADLTFTDPELSGAIVIFKTSPSNYPLTGAVFSVTSANGLKTYNLTTNNGRGCVDGLKPLPSLWIVKELIAPYMYVVNASQSWVVRVNTTASCAQANSYLFPGSVLNIVNELAVKPNGSLRILKNGACGPLQGATFTLTGANGFSVSQTTTFNGRLCFEGIAPGTYKLQETAAPDGYIIDPTITEVEIASGTTCVSGQTLTLTNEIKRAAAKVWKYIAGTKTVLPGATIQILEERTGHTFTTTTNAEGYACVEGLQYGEGYTLRELTPPSGYSLNETRFRFTPYEASTCADTTLVFAYHDVSLYQPTTCALRVDKFGTNKTGTFPLSGATFSIIDGVTNQKVHSNVQTGVSYCFAVPVGKYLVREEIAPKGWTGAGYDTKVDCSRVTTCKDPVVVSITNTPSYGFVKVDEHARRVAASRQKPLAHVNDALRAHQTAAHASTDAHTNANANANTHVNAAVQANTHVNSAIKANTHANANANTHANANANTHANANANTHANANAKTHANANAKTHATSVVQGKHNDATKTQVHGKVDTHTVKANTKNDHLKLAQVATEIHARKAAHNNKKKPAKTLLQAANHSKRPAKRQSL